MIAEEPERTSDLLLKKNLSYFLGRDLVLLLSFAANVVPPPDEFEEGQAAALSGRLLGLLPALSPLMQQGSELRPWLLHKRLPSATVSNGGTNPGAPVSAQGAPGFVPQAGLLCG